MPKTNALDLARNDLTAYSAAMWPPFELAPHHRTLVATLERVERGELDRVIIAMPPRHGKSLITSTLFPAWYLGRHPDRSIIASSYGQELASDFGRRVRNFVTDPLHRAIFPNSLIVDDSNAVHRFGLSAGGNYYATGSGGSIVGRGANVLVVDDPIKSREVAYSVAERKSLQSWYESVAYTRLQPGGSIINIATRWHEADLTGWLLKEHASEGWKVISMPAIAEENEGWRDEGDALWPSRFPIETLMRIKEAIGTQAWLSLYQQRPIAEEGSTFHRDWWRTYRDLPECRRILFSLDTAFKATESADYSVLEVWGETSNGYYLLHVWRARAEFPELKRQAVALADIWRPHAVLIEDAASGQSLIQALKAETRLPVLPVKPQGDKVARASAVSPLVESGRVFVPEAAPWLSEFMDEVSSFPASPHDDQTDALSQGLNYLRGAGYQPISWTPAPSIPRGRFAEPRAGSTSDRRSIHARGADVAKFEDAQAARLQRSWSSRWKNSGY